MHLGLLDICAVLVATGLLFYLTKRLRGSKLPLPPSPAGLPLVGNAFSLPDRFEWLAYHKWAEELGTEVLHLNMMGQSLIILDTAKAVSDLLEKRSLIYSSRAPTYFLNDLVGLRYNFGEKWRQYRRITHAFFGPKATANYRPQTLRSARYLMCRLLEDSEKGNIKSQLQYMAGETIMALCYGVDINAQDGLRYFKTVQKGAEAIVESAIPGKFLVDFLPILKYVPEWMPGAGFKHKAREWGTHIRDMVHLPFKAALKNIAGGTCPPCFICTTLQAVDNHPKGLDMSEVARDIAGALYAAGADTTVATISSCILALLGRPEVVERARSDLDRVIKPGRLPDFDDEPSLPFITAIVKEALRWREVAPLGLPHYLEVDDVYAGYRIPAGSIIMANQWAMLHDEEYYPEPFLFKPERFMNGNEFNYETKDPEFACWGFGRRICPGRFMGYSAIWITLASLIYAFDIEKEIDENGSEIEPNPQYSSGLVFGPEPFPCRFKARSEEFAKLVQALSQD